MHGRWAHMDEFDQDEWLEHLEGILKVTYLSMLEA